MKIDKIVIACFRHDVFLLRPCVASIRYWYPDVEIELLKDSVAGDFSTAEIEKHWNVGVFSTPRSNFGWPWSKLAVLLSGKRERILFLDSDTVFLGQVLDYLSSFDEDFVVTGIRDEDALGHTLNAHYIDTAKMKVFDPSYKYPGFAFNGGQVVMTSGVLKEDDLSTVIDLGDPIRNRYPEMLKHGDQGALNYVFAKVAAEGRMSLRYADFWIWPGLPEAAGIELEKIERRDGYPAVLHWAGAKPVDSRAYIRGDILRFFTDYYYTRVPNARVRRAARESSQRMLTMLKIIKYRALGWDYI